MTFYEESDQYRAEIAVRQREKGAKKYRTPFNPGDWDDDELADHAMMEFHDGQEYVAGMRTRMRQMRGIINYYESLIPLLQKRISDLGGNQDAGRSNTVIQDGIRDQV